MTKAELQARHCELHRAFDELLACYISQQPLTVPMRSMRKISIHEFMAWSHEQALDPACANLKGGNVHGRENIEDAGKH